MDIGPCLVQKSRKRRPARKVEWELVLTVINKVYPVTEKGLLVGRARNADVRFLSSMPSDYHAWVVILNDGNLYVYDEDSLNGTYLNGNRLKVKEYYRLANNDILCFGSINKRNKSRYSDLTYKVQCKAVNKKKK